MRVISMAARMLVFSTLLLAVSAPAQVLAPEEIPDPNLRELQRKYFSELKRITEAAAAHSFPYHFYFSRALDLTEKDQRKNDQRSVQFDRYHDQTVLKITGNYFAAYSTELMKPEERARQTYQDVMLPILRAAVPALEKADAPQAFAFEISHHVRKKVLGVSSEGTENVVLILPKASALRLVAATGPAAQQAAVLEGEVFLNAAPIALWPRPEGELARRETAQVSVPAPAPAITPRPSKAPSIPPVPNLLAANLEPPAKPQSLAVAPLRDTSPQALKSIQSSYQGVLDRMVQELNMQAHFVRYAPPAFIPFHKGLYLELSLTTALPESAAGSQYKLAALAFDQHIAHLIRPTLAYFKEDGGDFDGIDLSTSVRLGADKNSDGSQVAVEFIFPLTMLRAYEQFDCTGQQLIDSGFVLINGERVSLNLQIAEAGFQLR
jgi:hypothetical protein